MSKLSLFFSLLGLAAFAALVWFVGPLVSVAGRTPLDSEAIRFALIVLAVVAWTIVVVWRALSARNADRKIADGMADAKPAPSAPRDETMLRALAEADALSARFRDTMKLLRRSGRRGARRLAELPWYVVIGPPGAGKTTALRNSGLHFPLADGQGEAVAGIGGTRQCNWWFADEAVLLDTAGRYTTQDGDASVDGSAWNAFLGLLRRYRRRAPVNGIIVAISVADLTASSERDQHARAIRQRIGELDRAFGLRVPVYLMLTKADRIAGFSEFFADLSRAERDQVWGATLVADSTHSTDGTDVAARVSAEFDALIARLNDRLLTRLDQERDAAQCALLFGFPREVAMLKESVVSFVTEAFGMSRYDTAAWLRGVYLTSATQSGTPLDRAVAAVARLFGLAPTPAGATRGPAAAQSYFVADLIKRVVFREAHLAGTDPRHARRRSWLHAAGYAVAAVCVATAIAVWASAYARDAQAIATLDTRVQTLATSEQRAPIDGWSALAQRLDALRGLRDGDAKSRPGDRGLRQAIALDEAARRTYLHEANRLLAPRVAAILEQMLRNANGDTDLTYAALKGYLMLGQPEHRDAAYLDALMQLQWTRELPQQPDVVARLQAHLDTLLAEGLEPVVLDATVLRDARATLSRVPLAELAYSRLKRQPPAQDARPFSLREALGPAGSAAFERKSGLSVDQGIRALFTARGYADVFVPQSLTLTQSLRNELWVVGTDRGPVGGGEAATLRDDVGRLYARDYIKAWKDLLGDLRIVRFRGTAQGMDILASMSGRASVLRSLLLAVDRNTRIAPRGDEGVAAKVTNNLQQAKAELSQLLAVSAPANRPGVASVASTSPAQQIADAFFDIDELVQADKDGRAPIDGVLERVAALYTELGAPPSLDPADAAKRADSPAGRALAQSALAQPQPVRDWLLQVAATTVQASDRQQEAALQKKRGDDARTLRDKINAAWRSDVLPLCTSALSHRYPIDRRSANDVTLKDFGRLFAPGGLIDAFVKDNLRPFIDTSSKPWRWRAADQIDLGAAPDALRPLELAAKLRDSFFRDGGNLPSVDFALRLLPTESGVQRVALAQGEQTWVDRTSSAPTKTLHWPSDTVGTPLVLTVVDASGRTETRSADGPWALFRLLDQATLDRGTADRVDATFRTSAHSAQLELLASSVVNPFQPLALDQFECPKSF